MSFLPFLAALLTVCLAGCGPAGEVAAASPPSDSRPDAYFLAQIETEIRDFPSTADNAQRRLNRLMALTHLMVRKLGSEVVDTVVPPGRVDGIRAHLEQGVLDPELDQAILDLCRLGTTHRVFPRLTRVTFPRAPYEDTEETVELVGYLFVPPGGSDKGYVFGHGGFGNKETWLDVLEEVAERTGACVLALDFEGTGESGGYASWSGRIEDFSAALDFLEERCGATRFGIGGHSGGGAYPAACAAFEDTRVSALVLWDCIFDFYDSHLAPGCTDPGGNPAALMERTFLQNRGRRVVPPEVEDGRGVGQRLDAIYQELETTLGRYRHPSKMLGQVQQKRRLAVLHLVAEDVIRPVTGRHLGETFFLPFAEASEPRSRFLNRPLPFFASGLFDRPRGRLERWQADLGQPSRQVVIPATTHGFELPGRRQATDACIDWLDQYL